MCIRDRYGDEKDQYVINTTRGEWVGIYTTAVNGRKFKFADIVQETSESHLIKPRGFNRDGERIPLQWILSIEEYKCS